MTSKDLETQLELDIINFLENARSQTRNDQVITLRHMFDKHIHLNKADYIMDSQDLLRIIGVAKEKLINSNMKVCLGENKTPVSQNNMLNLFLVESTINHLNKIGCLKKMPKFDKKEG